MAVDREGRPLLVVLRALKLGDLLTSVPALRALCRAFPGHHRVLAAPRWLEPLAGHATPIDEVVHTEPLQPLDPVLHHPDVAVNLHGRGPESTACLAATAPGRLIAFGADGGRPVWRPDEHEVARWCRLLEESGVPADPGDLRIEPPDVATPAAAPGATIVHPGAADGARRWPSDRWAAVARSEHRRGRTVLITGSAAEEPLASSVAEAAGLPDGAVLAGRTGILELAATVGVAGRVVCGDTGVAHVATAMGTPSVVLFGPVSPAHWGPPPLPHHIALWAGAVGDPHATSTDAGLLALTVDDVLGALSRLPEHAVEARG